MTDLLQGVGFQRKTESRIHTGGLHAQMELMEAFLQNIRYNYRTSLRIRQRCILAKKSIDGRPPSILYTATANDHFLADKHFPVWTLTYPGHFPAAMCR